MKTALKYGFFGLCILVSTALFSRSWFTYPEYFPHFSESVWTMLDQILGSDNSYEGKRSTEFIIVLLVSFIGAVAIVTIFWVVLRWAYERFKRSL